MHWISVWEHQHAHNHREESRGMTVQSQSEQTSLIRGIKNPWCEVKLMSVKYQKNFQASFLSTHTKKRRKVEVIALTGTSLQTGGTAEVNVNNPCSIERERTYFHFKDELRSERLSVFTLMEGPLSSPFKMLMQLHTVDWRTKTTPRTKGIRLNYGHIFSFLTVRWGHRQLWMSAASRKIMVENFCQ